MLPGSGGRSTGPEPARFALSFANVSRVFEGEAAVDGLMTRPLCVRDLYMHEESGPIDPMASTLDAVVAPHDSAFYCIHAATDGHCGTSGGCPAYSA